MIYYIKINIFYKNEVTVLDKSYDINLSDPSWLNFERVVQIKETPEDENGDTTIFILNLLENNTEMKFHPSEDAEYPILFYLPELLTPKFGISNNSLLSDGNIIQFNDINLLSVHKEGFRQLICKDKDAKIYTVQI